MEKTNLKTWGIISVFLLVLVFGSLSAQGGTYGGGDGTLANPYQIWTAQQMNTIGLITEDSNRHFILMADIDLGEYTGTEFNIIGDYFKPNFSGSFDGNGHKIFNFNYSSPQQDHCGLFGRVSGQAELKNITLINPNINMPEGIRVGALASRIYDGVVSDCSVIAGTVVGGDFGVGGLIGIMEYGTISRCYTTCDVFGSDSCYVTGGLIGSIWDGAMSQCFATGNVSGYRGVGGLMNGTLDATVFDCYATGDVSGRENVGGLMGETWPGFVGHISNCYSTGEVTGSISVGGFLGNREAGKITSCFWDIETSGRSDGVGEGSSSGITGKTTAEMMGQNMFVSAGWDFVELVTHDPNNEVWTMCRWADYPRFAWQVSVADSIYYVDESNGDDNNDGLSLETAFATIQKGIDTAWHGNTIIVLPGRYYENINIGAKRLTLSSFDPNHPEETIIDGNDLDSVVTFVGSENANCEMMGFTIMGGNAAGNGGGIQGNFTEAAISNCIIKDNVSQNRGGGVSRCDGVLERCIIAGNSAANRGGGLLDSDCAMTNCLIYDNSVGYLDGSTQGYGGGLYGCSADIINCTIAFNAAKIRAGGFDGCNGTIANCIVWGNEMEQLLNCSEPTYSCIQDWEDGGIGNINDNPLFADPNNEDYHLLANSPCIEAGDPNHAAVPGATDLDGNPRILDGDNDGEAVVDMGAYEAVVLAMVEVSMKFTPQALNPGSQGKWVKAHLVLPEGFAVEDVDADTAAVIEPLGIESEYMNVFINEEGLVEIEAAFRRGDFCGGVDFGPAEVTVTSRLIDGRYLYGTDTIRIIANKLGYVADLASYWLQADCGPPDWCGGLDVDHSSTVDFVDFSMSDGCCIKIIKE